MTQSDKPKMTSLAAGLGCLKNQGPAMLDLANGFGKCVSGKVVFQKLAATFKKAGVRSNAKARGPEYSGF